MTSKIIERKVGDKYVPVHVTSVTESIGVNNKGVDYQLFQVHGYLKDYTRRNVSLLVKKEYVQKDGYIIVNNKVKKVVGKWGLVLEVAEETRKARIREVTPKKKNSPKINNKKSYGLSRMYQSKNNNQTKNDFKLENLYWWEKLNLYTNQKNLLEFSKYFKMKTIYFKKM